MFGNVDLAFTRLEAGGRGHQDVSNQVPVDLRLDVAHAAQVDEGARGVTSSAVLLAVHAHYAHPLSVGQVVEAMRRSPDLRRRLQRPFLEGAAVPRSALLGACVGWEGLHRYGPDNSLPVYVLRLTP
jgi:hypothetical protein